LRTYLFTYFLFTYLRTSCLLAYLPTSYLLIYLLTYLHLTVTPPFVPRRGTLYERQWQKPRGRSIIYLLSRTVFRYILRRMTLNIKVKGIVEDVG